MNRKLEVVVENKEEAIIAEKAGADRLEISISPEKHGLSVNINDIASIAVTVETPCYVMIRPTGATYEYSEEEFQDIIHTLEICKLAGVKGISVGFLKDGKIDRERLEKVIESKDDLEIVFNRAIDSVINYEEEIEYLASLKGIDYVQTSGAAETVYDGRHRYKPFLIKYPNRFILSSALDEWAIEELIKEDIDNAIFQINSGSKIDGTYQSYISFDKIQQIKKLIS